MSVPKIKSMVIAALLLVNIFFLFIIVYDRAGDAQRERQALEDAYTVLDRAGIELDLGGVSTLPGLREMKTIRDAAAQRVIAEAVLGEVTETEQGGILYSYDGAQTGGAVFKSGGDFTISINEDVYPSSGDVTAVARGLMRDMGIEPAGFFTDGAGNIQTVTAHVAYRGVRIFNCTVSFQFEGGGLRTVTGKYASGVTELEDAATIHSPTTALLTFLAAIKKGEYTCERIDLVTAGYFARDATAFSDGGLSPVWLLETDTGRYIVDTATGEIQPMPD